MHKLLKKVLLFFTLFLLPFISIFVSFVSQNQQNRQIQQLIKARNAEQQPELMATKPINIHTTNLDWTLFNDLDQQFPTWEGTITFSPDFNSNINYNYSYLCLYNASTFTMPATNPNAGNLIWNHMVSYASLNYENNVSLVTNNDWVVYNTMDWNSNSTYKIIYLYIETFNNKLHLVPFDTTPVEKEDTAFSADAGVIDTFTLGHVDPTLDSSNVTLNAQDDFDVSFDLTINDGPGNVVVKANGVDIFSQSYTADVSESFTYTPPLEYTDYQFDFYLNGTLVSNLTKTVKSSFTEATVSATSGFEIKPNYQPSIDSIAPNGEVGASVTLDNPSGVAVDSVQFVLKDDQGTTLNTKNGSVSAGDLNTYEVFFSDDNLDAGNYTIDYTVNLNTNPANGPHQSPLTGTIGAIVTTSVIAAPELSFDEILVANHPSFEEGVSNWDNGQATVDYDFDKMAPENVILSVNYTLNEQTLGVISSGTIDPEVSSGSLTFNDLAAGDYYISWDMTWGLNSEAGTASHNGQTSVVTFVEVDMPTPMILNTNLSATEYYPNADGEVSGTITLHDYDGIIGKDVEITPVFNGSPLTPQTFQVPANGIITLSDWALPNFGDYTFELKVLDYKINSAQVEDDFIIGLSDVVTIVAHQFTTPNIRAVLERNNETNVLTLSVEALNGTAEKPWIDADGFNAVLTIRYIDGSVQSIPFTDLWADGVWDLSSPNASFNFQLDNTEPIEIVLISGEFTSTIFPNTRSIDIISPQVIETNLPTEGWNPWAIATLSLSIIAGALLLLWPYLLFLIGKRNKINDLLD